MKSASVLLFNRHLPVRQIKTRLWFGLFIILSTLVFSSAVNAEEWNATLIWGNKASLGTPISGVVVAVEVNAGDFVKQGSVLLRLDDRTQQADVLAKKAVLKAVENDREEAARELERTQELYDRTLISDHDLEVVVIQHDAAKSKYQMAKANLVRAELDLEYSSVRAPFDAWVVNRNVAVGQSIVSRLQVTPLFELVEAGFMLARISVPAEKVSSLHKKKRATISVAGKQYSGQVAHVSLEPTAPGSGKYAVDLMFNSGKTVLRSGLSATVVFK